MQENLKIEVRLDTRASQSLSLEGLRNEISRQIQVARKECDLSITERVPVVFTSRDEYILAAARLNVEYLLTECTLDTIVIQEGEDHIQMRGKIFQFSTKKWHSPVHWKDGDLHYGGKEFPHYWAAL